MTVSARPSFIWKSTNNCLNLDCFDVIRSTKDHVTIVDFSPFTETHTNSLAFEWPQLQSDDVIRTEDEDDPEFRYLAADVGIQPTSRNNYGIPQDVINMFKASSNTPDDDELANMNRLVIDQMQDEIRDDEN
jgi:hypothetical protein